MSLSIRDLRVEVEGREILRGLSLDVPAGEVHAVMGPNGSGKSTLSHVLMGRPGYVVTGGSVSLDGVELLGRPTWERAQAGLFLAMQYPIEVPGVSIVATLREAFAARGVELSDSELAARLDTEADEIGFDRRFADRAMNVDLSGGERKRNETMQLAVLRPRYAVLDELDSGLDVDALRLVSARIARAVVEWGMGVLAITHYQRLFTELAPTRVHVLAGGTIVDEGGPELAEELERSGYAAYAAAAAPPTAVSVRRAGAASGSSGIDDLLGL